MLSNASHTPSPASTGVFLRSKRTTDRGLYVEERSASDRLLGSPGVDGARDDGSRLMVGSAEVEQPCDMGAYPVHGSMRSLIFTNRTSMIYSILLIGFVLF